MPATKKKHRTHNGWLHLLHRHIKLQSGLDLLLLFVISGLIHHCLWWHCDTDQMFWSHKMLEIHWEMDAEQLSYFLSYTSDINIGALGAGFSLWTGLCMSGRLESAPGCCSLHHPPLAIVTDVAFQVNAHLAVQWGVDEGVVTCRTHCH